jgi:F0F1-type ATP synthase membrane subunit c/vacuolar-type H+-ATPase subunit K
MDMNLFNAAAMVMGLSLAGSAGGLHYSKAMTTAEMTNILNGKKTPGSLKIFAYAPMSQGLYGIVLFFIIMMKDSMPDSMLPAAFAIGVANMASGFFQGVVGARIVDMINKTGEIGSGFLNIGIVESMAIFGTGLTIYSLL